MSNAALQWVPGHGHPSAPGSTACAPVASSPSRSPATSPPPATPCSPSCATPRAGGPASCGHGARYIHILEPAEYLARFTALGCAADVWETTYHQLLQGPDPVLDWVKGTALRPVLTALGDDKDAADAFLTEYRDRLRVAYPSGPRGTVFPFRRIFAVARKEA